jgi:hypothetical protein
MTFDLLDKLVNTQTLLSYDFREECIELRFTNNTVLLIWVKPNSVLGCSLETPKPGG